MIWNLLDLHEHCAKGPRAEIGKGIWVPARPLPDFRLTTKMRAAWLVLTGKADAVVWPETDQ